MSQTTIVLNEGSGGDVMDGAEVVQTDPSWDRSPPEDGTEVKREIVVLGQSDGTMVNDDYPLSTADKQVLASLRRVESVLIEIRNLLLEHA